MTIPEYLNTGDSEEANETGRDFLEISIVISFQFFTAGLRKFRPDFPSGMRDGKLLWTSPGAPPLTRGHGVPQQICAV